MSVTTSSARDSSGGAVAPGFPAQLWRRDLAHYPESSGRRYGYLAIVVLTTIILYYQLYIQGGVATSIIAHFGFSFLYFVYISVIGNFVGAFASLLAGLADRWGRANLVVYGVLVTSVLVLILPSAGGPVSYTVLVAAISFVEGIVLVATPALVRDFSPQLGRATAMGYWTMGPVIGSLVVTSVTSSTLSFSTWQDEVRYSGYAGIVVFLIALFGLRELSPRLRDQIMVSLSDRLLIEARAKGLDLTKLDGQWRQMLRLDVIGPAFGVAVFLLLYYSAVGIFVIYFATNFGFSEQATNGLLNWYWISNAVALLVAGLLSDRLRVRKPFMIVGGVGSVIMTVIFASLATQPTTSPATFAWVFVGMSVCGGIAYAPWMASFTETVERHNPAATATGLAVWGWIVRIVVAVSTIFIPIVVSAVNPLVEHGAEVSAAAKEAGPALAIVQAHPQLFAELGKYPANAVPPEVLQRAVTEVSPADLAAVAKVAPQLKVLQEHGTEVAAAAAAGPGQWQAWWYVCLAGQVVFLAFVFVMSGRWSPRKAKSDAEAHRLAVEREMAALNAG
ncbi:MFS transporter [Pseudonocardia sp. GCM10023141]|uniref:MFS transporter n=1 Tax=Pseudonocardia sp. GCM10023141 TaxID=3252653 RepID=UPI0036158744